MGRVEGEGEKGELAHQRRSEQICLPVVVEREVVKEGGVIVYQRSWGGREASRRRRLRGVELRGGGG